jgi:hypothetical protein
MSDTPTTPRLDRRAALKFLATGAAAGAVPRSGAAEAPVPAPAPFDPAAAVPRGGPSDPSLTQPDICPWPKLLTDPEMKMVTLLADLVLPADDRSPAASAAGVPDFINEWVSAPYPLQQTDLAIIRPGLAWLNTESFKRHGVAFIALPEAPRTTLLDSIATPAKAAEQDRIGAVFFQKFLDLCLSGFYSSAAGFEDLQYKGNLPMPTFPGPPPEVLRHLGLA